MFITVKQLFVDDSGNSAVCPISIQVETISCLVPSMVSVNQCMCLLTNGTNIIIEEPFYAVQEKLERLKNPVAKPAWIMCEDLLPDVEDDYIVSLDSDQFRSYSVDVDSYRHGKWKTYGKKVIAWMSFPSSVYDT